MQILYKIKGIRGLTLRVENFLFNLIYKRVLKNKVKIFGWPIIGYMSKNPSIKFGKNINMISNIQFSRSGIYHPCLIKLISEDAELEIGDNVGLNGAAVSVMTKIVIGNNCLIGANAMISDTDYHPINPDNRRFSKEKIGTKPIIIGNNVFIGRNAMILKGVTIGDNSIIGAGSVVSKSIPPNEIWAGNPAKFIKKIEQSVSTVEQ